MAGGATCIAYETVTDADDGLPLLARMSAGSGPDGDPSGVTTPRSPQWRCRSPTWESLGVLSARVLINGRGVVGEQAIEMTVGLGVNVTVLDNIITVLDRISRRFGNTLEARHATPPTRSLRSSRSPATNPLHPSRECSLHMGMLSSFDGVRMSMPLQPRPRQSVRREAQCPHAMICHGSQAASPQEAEFLADRVQPATAPRSSLRRFHR
jgi:hypothetical protein